MASVEQVSPAAPAPAVVDTSASDLDVAATADYAEQMLNCQMRIDSLARDFDLAEAEAESASEGCSGMYTFHFHNGASSSSARSVLGRRILEEIECMNQIVLIANEAGVIGEEYKAIKNIQKALTARILKGDGDAAVAKTAAIKNIQKALTARILKGDAAVAKTAAIKNIQKALTARILKGDGDAAVAKTAAIKNIQKALTARILKGDGDAAVAKTAAIKNIQKALTARILKSGDASDVPAYDNVAHAAYVATGVQSKGSPPKVGLGHGFIPATHEDFDNAQGVWGSDWAKYRAAHPHDQDCSITESDNWKGAQQCSQSWECRGARLCERGGWCSGYDGCEGTPLPDLAPGLATDC